MTWILVSDHWKKKFHRKNQGAPYKVKLSDASRVFLDIVEDITVFTAPCHCQSRKYKMLGKIQTLKIFNYDVF